MAARKKAAGKVARKKAAKRKIAGPRELIDTGTNKLFVRRNERGTSFAQVVDVSRSLSQDRRRKAKKKVKAGYGDKGDRAPSRKRATAKRGPAKRGPAKRSGRGRA
jgi:hypothetical protein